MPSRPDIAVVTDEVADTLGDALALAAAWGITRVELREGARGRFPGFTPAEVALLDGARRDGVAITAASPGLFKGAVSDAARRADELTERLPRSLDLAVRLGIPVLIVFGFERVAGETEALRPHVVDALRAAAEAAAQAGLVVAVENEPAFWADTPDECAALVEAVGHPALRLNWDPANLHWGGVVPTHEGLRTVLPHLAGLHVKDYYPPDPGAPWRALGEGVTPWPDLLRWVAAEADLPHITLETHTLPKADASRRSLDRLRAWLDAAVAAPAP